MIKIIPAILPSSFENLTETLERLRGIVSTVQVDVVDGVFAPNRTWPYDKDNDKEFAKIVSGEQGMPFWKEFDFEVDLMVRDAAAEVEQWVQAGAARIVVHQKSKGAREALQSLQELRGDGKGFISLGVALAAHAKAEDIEVFDGLYDFVQVMGIDHEGFQGEPPDPHHHATVLVRTLRTKYPDLSIGVDGGVRMENIEQLVEAGASRLIIGSLIIKDPNPREVLRRVIDIANHQRV